LPLVALRVFSLDLPFSPVAFLLSQFPCCFS
jgi:hypothetical protein